MSEFLCIDWDLTNRNVQMHLKFWNSAYIWNKITVQPNDRFTTYSDFIKENGIPQLYLFTAENLGSSYRI